MTRARFRAAIDRRLQDTATAHRLYAAHNVAFGEELTGTPYPVKPWAELPDHVKQRHLHRAAVFATLGHLPLPERCYRSWHCNHYTKDWQHIGAFLRMLWECVAAEYARLEAMEQAA